MKYIGAETGLNEMLLSFWSIAMLLINIHYFQLIQVSSILYILRTIFPCIYIYGVMSKPKWWNAYASGNLWCNGEDIVCREILTGLQSSIEKKKRKERERESISAIFTCLRTFTPSWIGWGRPASDRWSFFTWKPTNLALVWSRNCSKSFCLCHTHKTLQPLFWSIIFQIYN